MTRQQSCSRVVLVLGSFQITRASGAPTDAKFLAVGCTSRPWIEEVWKDIKIWKDNSWILFSFLILPLPPPPAAPQRPLSPFPKNLVLPSLFLLLLHLRGSNMALRKPLFATPECLPDTEHSPPVLPPLFPQGALIMGCSTATFCQSSEIGSGLCNQPSGVHGSPSLGVPSEITHIQTERA